LVRKGAEDFHLSIATWQAFLQELTEEAGSAKRPGVLVTADGIDHWMGPTLYRDSNHKFIHAHQFTLVRQFVDMLFSDNDAHTGGDGPLATPSGFVNGGMVLFCTSGSNTPSYPNFDLLISQIQHMRQHDEMRRSNHSAFGISSERLPAAPVSTEPSEDPSFPLPKPYSNKDKHVLKLSAPAASGNVNVLELKGLSIDESKGYLDYFAQSGLLRREINDKFVGEMRGLSGGGVIGELAKLGRRVIA